MKFTYVTLSDHAKLNLLQEHQIGTPWPNLDQAHWCLHCEQSFNGHSTRVLQTESGKLFLECGTPGCDGSPIDWAPYPWWDRNHPATRAYYAEHPDDPSVIEQDLDSDSNSDSHADPFITRATPVPLEGTLLQREGTEELVIQDSTLTELMKEALEHHGKSMGCAPPQDPWLPALETIQKRLQDDHHFEKAWDAFFEQLAGKPAFLKSSARLDHPKLRTALQRIIKRTAGSKPYPEQMLMMSLQGHLFYHGIIQVLDRPYIFLYFDALNLGSVRSLSRGEEGKLVIRFQIMNDDDDNDDNNDDNRDDRPINTSLQS